MNADTITALIKAHAWLPLAALAIGLGVRLLKSDTKIPIDIPPQYRVWFAVILGIVAGVLDKAANGTPWKDAIIGGLSATALAVLGHNIVIDSARGGKEFNIPGLIVPDTAPGPGKPTTLPPPPLVEEPAPPLDNPPGA